MVGGRIGESVARHGGAAAVNQGGRLVLRGVRGTQSATRPDAPRFRPLLDWRGAPKSALRPSPSMKMGSLAPACTEENVLRIPGGVGPPVQRRTYTVCRIKYQ